MEHISRNGKDGIRTVPNTFPKAKRIADRFHVNAYIIEALNGVRRRVSNALAPQAKLKLKKHKHLLNKRNDQLKPTELKKFELKKWLNTKISA